MAQKYVVSIWVEGEGKAEDDPSVTKEVDASTPESALDVARDKVRMENPEINHMKIWFWTIRRLYE